MRQPIRIANHNISSNKLGETQEVRGIFSLFRICEYKGKENIECSLHLRPNLSPQGPAKPAPQKAPPVKNDTTIPLKFVNTKVKYYEQGRTYVWVELGLLKKLTKEDEAITSAMTPLVACK
jgi:hypothetical protein